MFETTKSIIVSGASGYLGSALCNHFYEQNWKVIKAGRNIADDIHFDLNFPKKIAQNKINEKADLFIHTAAANEVFCKEYPYESILYNVLGTKAAIDFCCLNKINKFVYISTFHVFGNPQDLINEKTIPTPVNDYGLTHLQAEQYVDLYT